MNETFGPQNTDQPQPEPQQAPESIAPPQQLAPDAASIPPATLAPSQETVKQPNRFKKMAINIMIGSLIGSALIAVTAVLVGEFNSTFGRALFSLLVVTVHALACLGFIENREKTNDTNDLKLFTNTIFVLIILSFLTAVFGIWLLLTGAVVGKLYGTYFIIAFATLHGEMLFKTTGVESKIDKLVYVNYIFMALVVLLIIPVLWASSDTDLPGFYYRLLAALAIVDATLTILAVIFNNLYLQKHPAVKSDLFAPVAYIVDASGNRIAAPPQANKRRMHPLLILLMIYLLFQFIAPLVFFIGLAAF